MHRTILALALFTTFTSAMAGSRDGDRHVSLPVEHGYSSGVTSIEEHTRLLRQIGEIAARAHIRDQVRAGTGGRFHESSGHRPQNHERWSPAHDHGAIDVMIPGADLRGLHQRAADIS